jgi:TorA maturation chaperone TorD
VYFSELRLLFGKETLEVREWYGRYGLQLERKNREPDDHLGLELLFVSHLLTLLLQAQGRPDGLSAEAIAGDLREFLCAHPLRWARTWAAAVLGNARSDFYKGLALLVVGALEAVRPTPR